MTKVEVHEASDRVLTVAKMLYESDPEIQSWDGAAYTFEEVLSWTNGWEGETKLNRAARAFANAQRVIKKLDGEKVQTPA